ncbi:MAG: type pilus assembly protein PilB [Patescibacteria group bacterium]|nr:type pilus assembly protein PilB [Patescibacteria group bacterium]
MGNEQRDKERFRQADEAATMRRAQLLHFDYLDTRNYTLPNGPVQDVITVSDMYKDYFTLLSSEGNRYGFAITNRTPQSITKDLQTRFPDKLVSIKMISESGWRELMRIYDPPIVTKYEDINISDYGSSDNLMEVSKTLQGVNSDDLLGYIIAQSYKIGASDIHFENARDFVRIRFRLDGMLHIIAILTHQKYYHVQQSIAVRAGISSSSNDAQTSHLSERVKNQDTGEEEILNMRIETVPTVYGQDAVLRLFNFDIDLLELDKLGLSAEERAPIDSVISHPHGMVLVVGPTGSGKTTTLYSILMRLNTPERKLMTLEDPVEYGLDGMSQIPVDTRGGDSFANKLRAVMRLDPDVIMVGEIRDEDTAHTSLQASITGHLVLSTFHASSAAAAMSRMIGLVGRNPIFASAVKLIISQRLVRRLDPKTRQPYKPSESMVKHFQEHLTNLPAKVKLPQDLNNFQLYNPGKSAENPFGYKGRTSIIEELMIGPVIQDLLNQEVAPTAQQLEEAAKKQGMVTMYQTGLIKCLAGETTLEEINRVL